jgi:hypothetical protein
MWKAESQELCFHGYVTYYSDTEIDPLESRVDMEEDSSDDELIMNLQKKMAELEKRIKRL